MALDSDAFTRLAVLIVLITGFQVVIASQAVLSLEQEVKRRWQHALTGHIMVQASYIIPISYGIAGLLIGAIGMIYFRLAHPDKYLQAFRGLLRPEELEPGRMPGAFYFLLGTALTCLFFDLNTARYAVECLAVADPMAAFVGKSVPSPRIHPTASLAGCIGCYLTAALVGYMMLDNSATWFQISMGALACCIAESIPFGNDNLLIPLLTSAALECSRHIGI